MLPETKKADRQIIKLRLNLILFGGSWGTDDNHKKTAFSSLLLGADDRYQSASV
jgi:hypothetical protein